jgi:hypothetical protein
VLVNVVAEGRNIAKESIVVCGHFSFFDAMFALSPDMYDRSGEYDGHTLAVPGDFVPPDVLECEQTLLEPGESIAHGTSFSFDPRDFEDWTGEVSIQCYFFAGRDGTDWRDVKRVNLGSIRIPIRPIGQPLRRP